MSRRVLVLFGGISSEHEISVVSAQGICGALDPERFEVIPVGITKEGAWVACPQGPAALTAASGILPEITGSDGPAAVLRRGRAGAILESAGEETPIDVVFPVLHGEGGEDGAIQGYLETIGVPYVGAGVAASALGMAKHLQKSVLVAAGVDVTPWLVVRRAEALADMDALVDRARQRFGLPVFVKPSSQGSSVGVHKPKDAGELAKAIEDAVSYDGVALIEEAIAGHEVEVAVLGDRDPEASVVGEIVPCHEFYDFEAKYLLEGSELIIPADLPSEVSERVRTAAIIAYRAIGCEGMARIDFFVSGDRILCNEINTIPGFTPISMYPKLWEATGVAYPDLLGRLIDFAVQRDV